MKRATWLMIGAGLVAAVGVAFADPDEPPPPVTGGPETGSGSGSGSAAPTETAMNGAWLGALVDRPYSLPKAKIGAYGEFGVITVKSPATMGLPSMSATAETIHLGGAYGITDQISAGLDWYTAIAGDNTNKTAFHGPLSFFGNYQLLNQAKMQLGVTAALAIEMCGTFDTMGNCSTTAGLSLGAGFKYQVIPKLIVFTGGGDIGVAANPTVPPVPFGPGAAGGQLVFSFDSKVASTFAIPVGAGYQITPQIFAFLDTQLARIYLANQPTSVDAFQFLGSDTTKGGLGLPVTLGGFYSINNAIDAGLFFDFYDLTNGADDWSLGLGARWHN